LLNGEPVTVIGNVPVGVEVEVESVRVLEQVGLHGLLLNPAVAPEGSPEAESVTEADEPETRVRVIVVEPEDPWSTETFPELESV
jgi:hypothetical protein